MDTDISNQQEIESLIGFKLNRESISRIVELRLKAGFTDFDELFCSCLGTLEVFLKEIFKGRVFVTLHEKYISDIDNWDKKVWQFDIEFLNKDKEIHTRNLEVLQRSRFEEPDYNIDVIKDLLGSEIYEDIIVNSIVLVEWILTEIGEKRIIGSVDRDEFENMSPANWRIMVLYTTNKDISDYKYSWDV